MIDAIKERAVQMLEILSKRQDTREKFKLTFDSPHGREVLKKICKDCGVGKSAFDPKSDRETAYRLGQQSVALEILRFMGMNEEHIMEQIRKDAEQNE